MSIILSNFFIFISRIAFFCRFLFKANKKEPLPFRERLSVMYSGGGLGYTRAQCICVPAPAVPGRTVVRPRLCVRLHPCPGGAGAGGCLSMPARYSFIPVVAMPSTKYFWKIV